MNNINKIVIILSIFFLKGCQEVTTTSHYNRELTFASSKSNPIYLSFQNTRNNPFYFLLERDTREQGYKIHIRWRTEKAGDVLFNGYETTLKFMINKTSIATFHPIRRPKVVSYSINSRGHEEEATFFLTLDEFMKIAYAENIIVELDGRYNTVIGRFNNYHTFKGFRDFAEHAH